MTHPQITFTHHNLLISVVDFFSKNTYSFKCVNCDIYAVILSHPDMKTTAKV